MRFKYVCAKINSSLSFRFGVCFQNSANFNFVYALQFSPVRRLRRAFAAFFVSKKIRGGLAAKIWKIA